MSSRSCSARASLAPILAQQVDRACDRFEAAWAAATPSGPMPLVEAYLAETPEPARLVLLRELLALDLAYRRRRGEGASEAEYRARFPGYEAVIDTVWHEKGVAGPAGETTLPTLRGQPSDLATEDGQGPAPDRDRTGAELGQVPKVPGERVEVAGYEVTEELGRGGMGVVYRARDITLNRTVALKMILAGGHAGRDVRTRFRTEAEAIARLHHPNIVQIYEVGEAAGVPYLTLEYVEGGTLAERCAGTPVPGPQAAETVETLARAMHAAHLRGIVHRDLKPGNVLLTADGVPKVTDFGLAKLLDQDAGQTLSGAPMGTPSYMSPEQAAGKSKDIGPAADVYALGAILYQLLTGRPPFRGPTPWDTMQQVVQEEPVSPRELQNKTARDLEIICLKCLEKLPLRRYGSAEALADDLRRFLSNKPILARPAGRFYRLRKFSQRHKGLVAGLAAVFLTLVAGVIGASLGWIEAWHEQGRAREAEASAKAAEKEASRLLAVSHSDAARLAMRRGAWRAALDRIEQALAAGHPDSAALRLDKVRALCSVNEVAKAAREIDELSRGADLGDLEGRVMLWKADLALDRVNADIEGGLKLVHQALAKGLPPAETAYAQGLLAPTSPKAVEQFQLALEEDALNPRVHGMLGLLLTLLGRHREAELRISVAELLFPEDPSFRVTHALLLALQDNMPAATAQLERARAQLSGKQMESARALAHLCNQMPRLGPVLEQLLTGEGDASPLVAILQVMPAITKAQAAVSDAEGDLFLPAPLVLRKALQGAADLTNPFALAQPKLVAEKLGHIAEIHPEGFLSLTRGALLGGVNTPESWAQAEKAFLQAAELPSLFPVRRAALFGAASSQWVLSREGPKETRAEMKRRAGASMRKLMALEIRPEQGYTLSVIALELKELDVAHWVLDEWERQAPKDPRLPGQRAYLAFHSGAYGRAKEFADRLLEQHPKDAGRWQHLRDAAVSRLRQQAEALGPEKKAGPR